MPIRQSLERSEQASAVRPLYPVAFPQNPAGRRHDHPPTAFLPRSGCNDPGEVAAGPDTSAPPRRRRVWIAVAVALLVSGFGSMNRLYADDLSPVMAGQIAASAQRIAGGVESAWRTSDSLLGPLIGRYGRLQLAREIAEVAMHGAEVHEHLRFAGPVVLAAAQRERGFLMSARFFELAAAAPASYAPRLRPRALSAASRARCRRP